MKKRCRHVWVDALCSLCGRYKRGSDRRKAADFWAKVDKDGPLHPYNPALGKCWVWNGAKTSHGYGEYGIGGRVRHAHQVACFLVTGSFADGLREMKVVYLHSCDRKFCVNPAHLTPASQGENMRDLLRKGRRTGVLLPDQVRDIKALYFSHGSSLKEIATKFRVSVSTVRRIVKGRTWKALNS